MVGWFFLITPILLLSLAILALLHRRRELTEISNQLSSLAEAKKRGSHKARLQYPHIDLRQCVGCGTCVQACPEDGVLGLIHGQAAVIHGSRCVGHGLCAKECPVGAISLTLGDISQRRDIPALNEQFESRTMPGLFLAGELTGYALIRTAIAHGTAIAEEVGSRKKQSLSTQSPQNNKLLDLCIIGAGPAGIACALGAKKQGLKFLVLEQESMGGTVAKYPRRKLVMTQPVDLPLHGRLNKTSYSKEELMEEWEKIVRKYELPIKSGEEFTGLEKATDDSFTITTKQGQYQAQHVCLALGRRGTPLKLNVPGEDLPKVAYSLLDAQSYRNRKILVVGGGDSAIEAALGLAEQPGNQVTLSYRRAAFSRLKARNEARIHQASSQGKIQILYESEVQQITPLNAVLLIKKGNSDEKELVLHNEEVFIFAGGLAPFELLERCGVSFNPKDRPSTTTLAEQGTGLLKSLFAALCFGVALLCWAFFFRDYYSLPSTQRFESSWHSMLRPSGSIGLLLGIAASVLIVTNLAYLWRRASFGRWIPGSLQGWMSSHVLTGILAFLFIAAHSAFLPQKTVGGHAFWALGFLVVTGAIGRYFYSFVPRAANGQELALEDVQGQLANLSGEWDRRGRGFGEKVREEIHQLIAAGPWKHSFLRRLLALVRSQKDLHRSLKRLHREALQEGLAPDQVQALIALAKKAHRTAFMAAHYEDLRAIMASWRYFHRWVALLMVLLAGYHIFIAIRYGSFFA